MRTDMPSGNIKTVTFKINLSEYGYNRDTYAMASGNINIGSRNIKPTRSVAVSSQTPSGNINAVSEIIKLIRPVAI